MIYALLAGSVHHALHLQDTLTMLAAARWEEVNPLYQARVLVHGDDPLSSSLERRLRRQKAQARRINDRDTLRESLQDWHPQLLIFANWNHELSELLLASQDLLLQDNTAVMALGPEGDEAAMSALDAGANVYVGTPSSENLILAQAGALLRHGHLWEQVTIDIPGVLRIDPESRRVFVYRQELQLTKRIFRLFHYLAQQPEHTFSTAEIAQQLAISNRHVRQNTVAAQIHRLRKTLELVGASSWLQTVHGFGYRLSIPKPEAASQA